MESKTPVLIRRYDHLVDVTHSPEKIPEEKLSLYNDVKNAGSQGIQKYSSDLTGKVADDILIVAANQRDEKTLSIVLESLPLSIEGFWEAIKEVTYNKEEITAQDERIGKLLIGSLIERGKVYGLPKYAIWPTTLLGVQIKNIAQSSFTEMMACINKDENEREGFKEGHYDAYITLKHDKYVKAASMFAVLFKREDLLEKIKNIFQEVSLEYYMVEFEDINGCGISAAIESKNIRMLDQLLSNNIPESLTNVRHRVLLGAIRLLVHDISVANFQGKSDEISEMMLELLLRKTPERTTLLNIVIEQAAIFNNLILIKKLASEFDLKHIAASTIIPEMWNKNVKPFIPEEKDPWRGELLPKRERFVKASPEYKMSAKEEIAEYIKKIEITQLLFTYRREDVSMHPYAIIRGAAYEHFHGIRRNSPQNVSAQEKLFSLIQFLRDNFVVDSEDQRNLAVLLKDTMTNTLFYKHLVQAIFAKPCPESGGLFASHSQEGLIDWAIRVYSYGELLDGAIVLLEALILDKPIDDIIVLCQTAVYLLDMYEKESPERKPLATNLLRLLVQQNPEFLEQYSTENASQLEKDLYGRYMRALIPQPLKSLRQKELGQGSIRQYHRLSAERDPLPQPADLQLTVAANSTLDPWPKRSKDAPADE